ncbi:7896_t:CDS:2, partial [Gigaspora rosea]
GVQLEEIEDSENSEDLGLDKPGENTFTKQEEKKEIREVSEEEVLGEKANKELIEMEKEPVEKEEKEQSRWMQIDTEKELKKEDKGEETENLETSFKKRAIVSMAIKDVKSKHILDETWSLPIERKLIRVFQGDSKEE